MIHGRERARVHRDYLIIQRGNIDKFYLKRHEKKTCREINFIDKPDDQAHTSMLQHTLARPDFRYAIDTY